MQLGEGRRHKSLVWRYLLPLTFCRRRGPRPRMCAQKFVVRSCGKVRREEEDTLERMKEEEGKMRTSNIQHRTPNVEVNSGGPALAGSLVLKFYPKFLVKFTNHFGLLRSVGEPKLAWANLPRR